MVENIRKLASIQRIDDIKPIENAEKIELAKILGWNVIIKKNEFKVGQLCIFCEIDSVLPERPEFEFLRSKKFRIKTFRAQAYKDKEKKQLLFSVISQGIAFPLEILSEEDRLSILEDYHINGNEHIIGKDLTEKLGIIKFELPISPGQKGNTKGSFPRYLIPATDEIRIQSIMKVLDEIHNKEVYITEKADGTSYTAYHIIVNNMEIPEQEQYVGVCSRNQELLEGLNDIYWRITHKLGIVDKLKKYYSDHGINIAVQGEICGLGVQKNRLGLKEDELFVYNIWNIDEQRYCGYEEFKKICKELGLKTVRTLWEGTFNFTLDELVEIAKGKYPNTNTNREGIVVRPKEECYSETITNYSSELRGRMSFKVMNIEYQLKEEE